MKHEFKPGDLAVIVGVRKYPEFLGVTVELVQRILPDELYEDPDGFRRRNVSGGASWVCRSDQFAFPQRHTAGGPGWAQVRESHLMPLRGDEDPDATLATERPTELVSA